MSDSIPVILENLRRASVQHGAAIKQLIADVKTLGDRLNASEAEHNQEFANIQAAVTKLGEALDPEGEAGASYDDDEEDAEYEEENGG